MSAIQEAPRESGTPVPAQRAARLPYETPPLQILIDPSNPTIDLRTQLGFGENTFLSSQLRPGRLMPTDLDLSGHVLDYRMDQMEQEPERLAKQVVPPSLLQRAGETLRKIAPPALIPATALGVGGAAVITIVEPSDRTLANGFKIEPGSINATAECVEDDPNATSSHAELNEDGTIKNIIKVPSPFIVYESDPDYAGKIARGEVLIAGGDGGPIAAIADGAKTAAIAILPITVQEALKNLAIPAEPCEAGPTPLTSRKILEKAITQTDAEIENINLQDVKNEVNYIWDKYQEELVGYTRYNDPSDYISRDDIDLLLKQIKKGYEGDAKFGQEFVNISRSLAVGDLAALLAGADGQSDNPTLKLDIEEAVDTTIDYGFTGITNKKSKTKQLKEGIVGYVQSVLSQWRFVK